MEMTKNTPTVFNYHLVLFFIFYHLHMFLRNTICENSKSHII